MLINAYFINKAYNIRELIGTYNSLYYAYKGTIDNLVIEQEVFYPYGNRREKQEIARQINMNITPKTTKREFSKLLHNNDLLGFYTKEWNIEFEPAILRRSKRIKQQQKKVKKDSYKLQIYTNLKFSTSSIKNINNSIILKGNSEKEVIDEAIKYLLSKNLLNFEAYQDYQDMFHEDEYKNLMIKENKDFTMHLMETINNWKELIFLCDICGWYYIPSKLFHFTNRKESNNGWTLVLHNN